MLDWLLVCEADAYWISSLKYFLRAEQENIKYLNDLSDVSYTSV